MKLQIRAFRWAILPERIRGMFNLNDPRWGRSEDKEGGKAAPDSQKPDVPDVPHRAYEDQKPKQAPNQGPPDLDELWRDLNRKLGSFFGGSKNTGGSGSGGGFQPDMKSAGVGVGLIIGVVLLIWLGTGVFIVQEVSRPSKHISGNTSLR
jgi:membrane protease subunit HflK